MTKFSLFAYKTARITGRASAFLIASLLILVWLVTGPMFQFSDTWQLIINTGTTIVTFLMVFLIQNAQNRDTDAIQMKLDELILVTQKARNSLLDLEELDEAEIERLRKSFLEIAKEVKKKTPDPLSVEAIASANGPDEADSMPAQERSI